MHLPTRKRKKGFKTIATASRSSVLEAYDVEGKVARTQAGEVLVHDHLEPVEERSRRTSTDAIRCEPSERTHRLSILRTRSKTGNDRGGISQTIWRYKSPHNLNTSWKYL